MNLLRELGCKISTFTYSQLSLPGNICSKNLFEKLKMEYCSVMSSVDITRSD